MWKGGQMSAYAFLRAIGSNRRKPLKMSAIAWMCLGAFIAVAVGYWVVVISFGDRW